MKFYVIYCKNAFYQLSHDMLIKKKRNETSQVGMGGQNFDFSCLKSLHTIAVCRKGQAKKLLLLLNFCCLFYFLLLNKDKLKKYFLIKAYYLYLFHFLCYGKIFFKDRFFGFGFSNVLVFYFSYITF